MKQIVVLFPILLLFTGACSDEPGTVDPSAIGIVADQQYYSLEPGTTWTYRFDTTGTSGATVEDVYRKVCTIQGTYTLGDEEYCVQLNETITEGMSSFDSTFFRKADSGLYATSYSLQQASLFEGFEGFSISIPREVCIMPYPLVSGSSWTVYSVSYSPMVLLTYYFRVTASYRGVETVETTDGMYRNCARILITVEALLPDLENPTDFLHPYRLNKTGNFWFIKPGGIVAGDGAQIIFDMLNGRIPNIYNPPERMVHQVVLSKTLAQPDDPCAFR